MKKLNTMLVLLPVLFTCACKHFLDEKVVSDVSYSYYDTKQGIESGVDAAYDPIRYQYRTESCASLQELGTDTYHEGRDAAYRSELDRYEATLNPSFGALYDYWSNYYRGINSTNTLIDAIAKLGGNQLSDDFKAEKTGEMRFLRGLYYFNLVRTFGEVPLVTKPSLGVRTDFPRAPVADIYQLIIADLRFAVDHLPAEQSNYGRATKGAAEHALALTYLTRGSAVTDQRGQKPTDMDSAAYYADLVIFSGKYHLVPDFKDLWDINNQQNDEVVFAVQFSTTQLYNNNSGNHDHLYFGMTYDLKPGMKRTIAYDRPWNRIIPTDYTILHLFDRKNDSRFYKTFQSVWFSNNPNNLPKWQAKGGFVPPPDLLGKNKFEEGDTSIWVTAEVYPDNTNFDSLYASRSYYYMPMNRQDNANFFVLRKYLDPTRAAINDENGSRDGILFRLGGTYLIAAEAYGRTGNWNKAADRLNAIRDRAAYKEGEEKPGEYWRVEEGNYQDRFKSTRPEMEVTSASLESQPSFVDFMLDERARELNGELRRWWDLVRTEKLVARVQAHNPDAAANIKPYHKLRPIPQNHIDRLDPKGSPEQEQNAGYY
jgi:hypothetical protein